MDYPNFNEERRLWKKGYEFVAGIDESGRGPLAGSVVAAAVVIRNFQFSIFNFQQIFNSQFSEVRDSKKLTPKQREEIFGLLKKCPDIEWGIGKVGQKVIDRINILEATKLAMARAVRNLEKKLNRRQVSNNFNNSDDYYNYHPVCQKIGDRRFFGIQGDTQSLTRLSYLLIDGNFSIPIDIKQKSIIKADEKVMSCVLAGIIAKVIRDKMMINYHKKYPQYGFDRHKGYPTKLHKKMIEKYGYCKIHRRSFSWRN